MTTLILLVRHASHDRLNQVLCGRMPGVTLGDVGMAEAAALGERLSAEPIAAVYTSPLERARQTAEAIAAAQGTAPQVDEDLNELDFGDWNGRAFEELHGDPAWRRWNQVRLHSRPPGGETMLEAQIRAARFLDRVRLQHEGETVAAVSHGDVIKSAIAYALGLPLEFYRRFDIAPASVSRIDAGEFGFRVAGINEAPPCRC